MAEVLVPEIFFPFYAGVVVNVIGKAPLQADFLGLSFPPLYKDCDPDTY